ncbi:MAG: tetratricopeptide repeat protein [Candidatus Bathyarchaeota archaeon]|nr:MAG: tetratricopeptide repeat protein [Candidatus Bathyarchaeota archaeon]
MPPIFGRKREPRDVFDEHMKKADELWKSPSGLKTSECKKIMKHIEKALEIAGTVEVDQEDIVRLWARKGSLFLTVYRRLDDALECYDKALSIDPGLAKAWINKGSHLLDMGKPKEAMKCIDTALEINPRYAKAWLNKGVALEQLGKPGKAIECCKRALKINPRYAFAGATMGAFLLKLDKFEEAMKCIDTALEINPISAIAWFYKGMALEGKGRHEEAKRCFNRATYIDPSLQKRIKISSD